MTHRGAASNDVWLFKIDDTEDTDDETDDTDDETMMIPIKETNDTDDDTNDTNETKIPMIWLDYLPMNQNSFGKQLHN